jgi:putative two-component system response regulator
MSLGRNELETLLQAGMSGSEPQVKTALVRLAGEIKHRAARGSSDSYDFFAAAINSLSRIRGPSCADTRFECAYACGQYFYVGGYSAAALESAHLLKALATLARDRSLEQKAFAFAGVTYNEVGDLGEAVANHSTALAIARELGNFDAEQKVTQNLGVALMDAGLYQEALPCFERVVGHAEPGAEVSESHQAALTNMAKIYLRLGQYERGLKLIQEVIGLQKGPADAFRAFKRTLREFIYVQLALELGQLSLARERAAECFRHAQFGGTPRSMVLARIANALCEIYGGRVEKGLTQLETTVGQVDVDASVLVDATPALVKAYDAAGRATEALQCLQELMGFVRAMRRKGIEALEDAHCGHVILGPDGDAPIPLRLLEADLRTKVAQNEALAWRIEMFERMASAADLREELSGEHSYRVGRLAALFAEALSWRPAERLALELAARLHDIGKVAMPDRILLSTATLREAERHFIATHTKVGAELLAGSPDPQMRIAEEIARHHHEWWNGEGYPSKLKGKRIPIHARIVALADVFDALTHGRPFSPPWSIDRALEEIRSRKGTQFDPELTDVFLDLVAKLRSEHQDLDEYLGRAGRNSPFLIARNKIRAMLAEERDLEKRATVEGSATHH